ncbi:hypothetical protein L1987_33901 [Smallanthus sonchifolius]|uniref:Uncharacterized protein n=1 Tax=Smallanthus sonchifolius TaxID=185202 RepID=A0ACB9HRM9_9ASTR|nr:hypothetical protein L1987_33901 [Smallanthus sonchifolius]
MKGFRIRSTHHALIVCPHKDQLTVVVNAGVKPKQRDTVDTDCYRLNRLQHESDRVWVGMKSSRRRDGRGFEKVVLDDKPDVAVAVAEEPDVAVAFSKDLDHYYHYAMKHRPSPKGSIIAFSKGLDYYYHYAMKHWPSPKASIIVIIML